MKKPRQFLPLLKQMLGIYRYGSIPLLLWFLSCGIVLFFSGIFSPTEWMRGHNGSAGGEVLAFGHEPRIALAFPGHVGPNFGEVQVFSGAMLWLFLMLVSTPLPFQLLGGLTSLEFLFTRAIDRAFWLRIERTAVIIIAAGPILINLALSPLEPKMAFDRAEPGSSAAEIQGRYMYTFPGSHLASPEPGHVEQLVIRHGTEMFAAWLAWAALIGIFLVAGYFTLVLTAWQRAGWHHSKSKWRPWLGGAMIYAPAFSVIFVFTFCMVSRVNLFEESFLFFAFQPVLMTFGLIGLILVVQPLSERNIRKLEFEFF